jgi:hypothetical protein
MDDSVPHEKARLMIDTGAQKTVVDRAIPDRLGLNPIRFEQMVGVSHVPQFCPVYLMTLAMIVGDGQRKGWVSFTTEMIGMDSPPQRTPHVGLLGRDFFRHVRIVYDGPGGCVDIHDLSAISQGHGQNRTSGRDKSKRKAERRARKKNRR